MTLILDHPQVPFHHHMPDGFRPGQTIIVRGRAEYCNSDNSSFAINLGIDPDHHENIALHLNLRLAPHKVVLNTLLVGEWGKEERHNNRIAEGEFFDIKIRAHEHHYDIRINDHHVGDYKYRIPSPMVNHIEVNGGVHIETIVIDQH